MISNADKLFLTDLFSAAVTAADPKVVLKEYLPKPPVGRLVIVGAGKGAAHLAAAFEELWEEPVEGVVVTRYGYSAPCKHIKVLEAAHPVPDEAGLQASHELFAAVENLTVDDVVVALICGGGSSLLPMPPGELTLRDEQQLNECLLASGAPIGVMNAIRKHVSGIKGGRLAKAAFPAKVISLVVSDVPGDDAAEVASGPTVPSKYSLSDARKMVQNRGIKLPERVAKFLDSCPEAPSVDDEVFARNEVHVIASAKLSLEAAARVSELSGMPAVILSDSVEGEARDVGQVLGAIAKEVSKFDRPFPKPIVMLSGGETTVTLRDSGGRGGRNTEFLLSFSLAIEGCSGIVALAADTDGIDGSENNAGAFADGSSIERMVAGGVDPVYALEKNDAWGAFDVSKDIFSPGPTGTNVNDFRAIIVR